MKACCALSLSCRLVHALALVVLLGGPSTASADEAARGYKLISDISYLDGERSEKMDAWLPDSARFPGPWPAVVVIHGGYWAKGDKATEREKDICSTLAKAGYAAFSINYFLTKYEGEALKSPLSESAWPTNFQDCRESIQYLRRHADDFGVDPDRVAVLGTSAGGHLALLTAFAPDSLHPRGSKEKDIPTGVRCVISMYGIHNLKLFGKECFPADASGDSVIEEASPVTYFSRPGPPVLIIHGDKDPLVKPSVAIDMDKRLKEAGVPHELIMVPGAVHSFHLHPNEMSLEKPVLDFLERYLKKGAPEGVAVPGTPPPH